MHVIATVFCYWLVLIPAGQHQVVPAVGANYLISTLNGAQCPDPHIVSAVWKYEENERPSGKRFLCVCGDKRRSLSVLNGIRPPFIIRRYSVFCVTVLIHIKAGLASGDTGSDSNLDIFTRGKCLATNPKGVSPQFCGLILGQGEIKHRPRMHFAPFPRMQTQLSMCPAPRIPTAAQRRTQ